MNPIYLAIPVFIAAVLTIAVGALFSIIHRKDGDISRLEKTLADIQNKLRIKKDVSKELEADLKQADEENDAKHKEVIKLQMELENSRLEVQTVKASEKQLRNGNSALVQRSTELFDKNMRLSFEAEQANDKYRALITMPRRKRDKLIAQKRAEMGGKVRRVKEVVKEGLVRGLTVKNPTENEAKEIFALAKESGITLHNNAELPDEKHCWLWYAGGGICRCVARAAHGDTYVTAKEFMQRMRNHVSK